MEELLLSCKNGSAIYGNKWEIENPKANFYIVTGMLEHSRRYDDFAKFLNNNGISVYCLDQRGQGENVTHGDYYGYMDDFGFKNNVDHLHELIVNTKKGAPAYLFGHSMGSFSVQSFIQTYPEDISKAIICGSNGKIGATGLGFFLAKILINKNNGKKNNNFFNNLMLGSYNKRIKNPRTSCDWLTTNEEIVDKYVADKYCGGVASGAFYKEFLRGLNGLYTKKGLARIPSDLPILIISGKEDPVGNYGKGIRKLVKTYEKLGLNAKFNEYEGMRHEILNEIGNTKVYGDILQFIS